MSKILVIDDSKFSRRRVVEPLLHAGYDIEEAVNGEEGLKKYAGSDPDCVVTDLLMPVLGGQEFIRRLRAGGSTTPVIVVTADVQTSSCNHCKEMGISGFLNKPFQADELLENVERALRQANEVAV